MGVYLYMFVLFYMFQVLHGAQLVKISIDKNPQIISKSNVSLPRKKRFSNKKLLRKFQVKQNCGGVLFVIKF